MLKLHAIKPLEFSDKPMPKINALYIFNNGDFERLHEYVTLNGARVHYDALADSVESVFNCEGNAYHFDIEKSKIIAVTKIKGCY